MKIKNLKINREAISFLLTATLGISAITGSFVYYLHENTEQICEIDMNNSNIFKGKDGKIYCYFDIGEHNITISRNDMYYYKSVEIEGYSIKQVEINGWRDNNKITYANVVPVIVEATKEKNGRYEFSDFGVTFEEKGKTKTYAPKY